MTLKPLKSDEEDEKKLPLSSQSLVLRKSFIKRRARSANEIGAWGNTEVEVGRFLSDEKDIIRKAMNSGLRGEKLG